MARVSRETAAAHREAIVAAAGRLFRARGVERVGVAEVTREAGLTHGGFYGHFASKEALAAEAIAAAFAESRQRIATLAPEAWVKAYLSRSHRDAPESGCPLPALAAEAARGDESLGRAFAEGLAALVEALADRLGDGPVGGRRAAANELVALMVGGQSLARSLARVDRTASDALLLDLRGRALDRLAAAMRPRMPECAS